MTSEQMVVNDGQSLHIYALMACNWLMKPGVSVLPGNHYYNSNFMSLCWKVLSVMFVVLSYSSPSPVDVM